jgi:hypothetical protein
MKYITAGERRKRDLKGRAEGLRATLGSTEPPMQYVPGVVSQGVKRPGSETDSSPPNFSEVKNNWIYISTFP